MTEPSALVRLIDTARMHLPGALEGALRMELFNVMKEFTQRTNVWQEEIELVVGSATYDYPLATNQSGAMINRLIWLEGKRSDVNVPDSGAPATGMLMTPGVGSVTTLRVPFPPSADETWYAHVALAIADPTTSNGLSYAPDWLADKHHLTILEGLLARMMSQPAKPYSHAQGALLHGRRFISGMSHARAEATHGFTYRGNNWRFPGTFRASSQR